MLNELGHLLVMISEEAVEVAQQCDKALRFGSNGQKDMAERHARMEHYMNYARKMGYLKPNE